MNDEDIELPPLPKASKMYDIPGYDEEELKDFARTAIQTDRARRALLAERDALIHDNAEYVRAANELAAENERLREELDQLRQDAERYRFIRAKVYASNAYGRASWKFHYDDLPLPLDNPTRGSVKQHFDDAIDAAMAKGGEA